MILLSSSRKPHSTKDFQMDNIFNIQTTVTPPFPEALSYGSLNITSNRFLVMTAIGDYKLSALIDCLGTMPSEDIRETVRQHFVFQLELGEDDFPSLRAEIGKPLDERSICSPVKIDHDPDDHFYESAVIQQYKINPIRGVHLYLPANSAREFIDVIDTLILEYEQFQSQHWPTVRPFGELQNGEIFNKAIYDPHNYNFKKISQTEAQYLDPKGQPIDGSYRDFPADQKVRCIS